MTSRIGSTPSTFETYQDAAKAEARASKPAEQAPDTVSLSSRASGKSGDVDRDGDSH